ncbi:hypothetical protein AnigIFM49718_000186 [Aspergillus niger]|nr:hypothetical protein AnigIFM49718_000186 [Aspergillus niger]
MSFGNNRVLGSGAALQAPTRELRSTTHLEAQPMTAQKIFNEIVRKIPKIHDFTEIVYEGIEPEKGALVCDSLLESSVVESSCARVNFNSRTGTLWVRVMPTELHDVHHRWVFNAAQNWTRGSLMTPDEMDLLDFGVGTSKSLTLIDSGILMYSDRVQQFYWDIPPFSEGARLIPTARFR